jgi:E3 ubiquitin-protein ligase HERC2
VITWFWQAMNRFSNDERILYLKFVWGRSRLPLTKDSFTQRHKIARSYSNHPDISLPLSHTCFFTIDIPPYSSYDILYNKILYAIRFCGEIDNDNNANQALEDL